MRRNRAYALPIVFLVLMLLTIAFIALLDTVHTAALSTGLHLKKRASFYACDGVVRLVRGQMAKLYEDNFDVTEDELSDAMDPIADLAHQYGIDVPPPQPPTAEAVATIPSGALAGMEILESTATVGVTSDPIVGCGWNLGQPLGRLSPLQFVAFSVGGGTLPNQATTITAGNPAFTWGRTALGGRGNGSIRPVAEDDASLRFPSPPTGTVANGARTFGPFLQAPTVAADGVPTTERSASRAFYNADLRIIDGVWYVRDPSAPTSRGVPVYGDHVCADNADPAVSCAAVHTKNGYAANRHALYSVYERHRTNGVLDNNNGVVSYGRRIGGGTKHQLLAAAKSTAADGLLPINIDVGLLVQALLTKGTVQDEIGVHLCLGGACTRRFNGQVYVTSTSGVAPTGSLAPDALCGENGAESTVESGASIGATDLFPCGTGARYNAVRLWNAADLRELVGVGLTVTSDLPLYVEGNWNTFSPSPPTMVMAPRVTLLSDKWRDDGTGGSGGKARFRGSILGGSTGRGAMTDVFRLLESDVEVELRGALVHAFVTPELGTTQGYKKLDWEHPAELQSPAAINQPPGVPRLGLMLPPVANPFFGGGSGGGFGGGGGSGS